MSIFFTGNLTFLRDKFDITQRELALEVGNAANSISNWEKGKSQPSFQDLEVLCNFFGVSAHDLLFTDFSNVQVSENLNQPKKRINVQGNVQASVQVNNKKGAELAPIIVNSGDVENRLEDAKKMVEILSIAVKGLESANRTLTTDLEEYKRQIELFKKEMPTLGKGMDNPIAKTAG